MAQGAFLEQKRGLSPTSLGVVIALHAAGIGALLLAKGPIYLNAKEPPIEVELLEEEMPPPEVEPERKPEPNPAPPQHVSRIETVPPIVKAPPRGPEVAPGPPIRETVIPGPIGEVDIPDLPRVEPRPVPPPVRVDSEIDPRFADRLQPPYPASEERAEREGSVRIEVTIGADGRVKAARRVSATSDAFWRATERHALGNWRFKPATLDGRPVESRKTMTVHFELRG